MTTNSSIKVNARRDFMLLKLLLMRFGFKVFRSRLLNPVGHGRVAESHFTRVETFIPLGMAVGEHHVLALAVDPPRAAGWHLRKTSANITFWPWLWIRQYSVSESSAAPPTQFCV
jgi:hypothetical protein